jgi:oligopeptidase A
MLKSSRKLPFALFATSTLDDNPLLQKNSLPLFHEIKSDHVLPAIEQDLSLITSNFKSFETELLFPQSSSSWGKSRIEYDFSSVVEKLETIQAPLSYSWGVVGHLMGVKDSAELREAHDKLQPAVVRIYQELGQSKPLFNALNALKTRQSVWQKLVGAQKRIVASSIRQMESSGVGLDAEKRKIFNTLQQELAEIKTKFSNNVLDSTKAFKLRITSATDVAGLPESALRLAAAKAVDGGDADASASSGPWVITLDMPSYLPAMQHLRNRALREKLYRAYVTRASVGESDNSGNIRRILEIKHELAALLGFSSYAELSLSSKMAPDVASVLNLIDMLLQKSRPAALKELQEVRDFARLKLL